MPAPLWKNVELCVACKLHTTIAPIKSVMLQLNAILHFKQATKQELLAELSYNIFRPLLAHPAITLQVA
jgi:hypothetical protein